MKVGYLGVKGSFSEMALVEYFGKDKVEAVGLSTFPPMFRAVESGELDYAMIPVENTTTGLIARTYDCFRDYDVFAAGEITIPIGESLLALPGAKLEDIREVYSHPEAITQCSRFFSSHPDIKPVACESTASSVLQVLEQRDLTKAALASDYAAKVYGIPVLLGDVQDSILNMTRFLCITNKKDIPDDADKVSIMLILNHKPGALFEALGVFALKGINVLRLESRPIPGKVFEYCFYIDFSGNLNEPDVAEAIRRLRYDSLGLRVLGNYRAAVI